MAASTFNKGAIIYKAGDKMKEVGLIMKGSVEQRTGYSSVVLEAGHLIGLAGCDSCVYQADYIALEDTMIFAYPYKAPADFTTLFTNNKDYDSVFILAALKQTALLLNHYTRVKKIARELYTLSLGMYRDYKYLCSKYSATEYDLQRMEYLSAIGEEYAIPDWKEEYYTHFTRFNLDDLKELFTNTALCVGTIEEAGNFMTQLIRRTDEIYSYLQKSKSVVLVDKKNDLFQLMFDLENRISYLVQDKEEIRSKMATLIDFIKRSGLYDEELVNSRITEYENFNFATCEEDLKVQEENASEATEVEAEELNLDETDITCFEQICQYAGVEKDDFLLFQQKLKEFQELPDRTATDGDARTLRRWLTEQFYGVYKSCVKVALRNGGAVPPVISMFLNFGFMDVSFVGGSDVAGELMELLDQLFTCNMDHCYTFFEWIKSIYDGTNEPSTNDLDMDFVKSVKEGIRSGDIKPDQEKAILADPLAKVDFELDNFFKSGGKLTCGHITSFCPILCEDDLLGHPAQMLVNSMKLKEAIDTIRNIDFGLFYREVMFSDEEKGISREYINAEIMPNIILLPNAGSKAMMWQVTAGVRNNTSARFMFPILCSGNIQDMMIENCGRYRWEMCRKVQGARWNDVTSPSLTSEYSDYLQYYRKNSNLSPEAKEKVRNTIKRARNNFREVFVYDYENWIKFEAKGSFRLNKVARDILFNYCPFSAGIREHLTENPMFQDKLSRYNNQTQKKVKRLTALYSRYESNGGEITPDLQANMDFYSL